MRNGFRMNVAALAMAMLLSAAVAPESPVADAAMRGDVAAVRALVKQGADVNAAQGDGMTALHWAAERGDAALAEVLVYAGANVRAVTRLGSYTPLHLASRQGHAAVVESLLDAGADANVVTATGRATALHLAAAAGSTEAITALLDHGANVNAREESWEQTPLMFAVQFDHVAAVRTLLARGADHSVVTRVVDVRSVQAMNRAGGQARDRVLNEFREKSPDPANWRPDPSQVQSALQAARAAQRGGSGAAPAAQADEGPPAEGAGPPGGVNIQGGMTALLHAAREGSIESAMALLDAGADVNQVRPVELTSPLLMATINGQFDLAVKLLERGADPNLASVSGTTPLYSTINTYWAPRSRYPQQQAYQQQKSTYLATMEALLEAGADPNARLKEHLWYMEFTFAQLDLDERGATPFWRAAFATDVDAMKLLHAYGADPDLGTVTGPANAGGRGGRGGGGGQGRADPSGVPPVPPGGTDVWPLLAATGNKYGSGYAGNSHRHAPDAWLASAKYLIEELGADVNVRDAQGNTPLHNAAARGDNELVVYLVEKGADVLAVNRAGQTTADMANGPAARISPFPATVKLLVGMGAINNNRCRGC